MVPFGAAALLPLTSKHNYAKQGNGYRWPHIALGRPVFFFLSLFYFLSSLSFCLSLISLSFGHRSGFSFLSYVKELKNWPIHAFFFKGWFEGLRISDNKIGWFPAHCVDEPIDVEMKQAKNLRQKYQLLKTADKLLKRKWRIFLSLVVFVVVGTSFSSSGVFNSFFMLPP